MNKQEREDLAVAETLIMKAREIMERLWSNASREESKTLHEATLDLRSALSRIAEAQTTFVIKRTRRR